MSTSAKDLTNNVLAYASNPSAIQRTVLQFLKDIRNGDIDIVDATTPFLFATQSSACCTSAAMDKTEASTRRLYPSVVQTPDELYRHMSDKDFVNRFATPASTKFFIALSKTELENKMVLVESLGIKKLVIPRNTVFTIADVSFSLQYPVEIRLMSHGGYQVVYDGDIPSPLHTLSTNHIDVEIMSNMEGEWLYFEVDVQQFDIVSRTSSLNAATGFKTSITIADQFYYCRVYHQNKDDQWVEMQTTHVPDIFDVAVPTAVVQVTGQQIDVSIPQIYTTTSLLDKMVRIDVYQTKGPINMLLGNYDLTLFGAQWLALDKSELTEYVAPLNSFEGLRVGSSHTVSGGSNAVSFETLRTRVMTHSIGINDLPITPDQRTTFFETKGYEVVKNIDIVTNRCFLATKNLPVPSNKKVAQAAASAAVGTVQMIMDRMVGLSGVIDNGLRVTVASNAIYSLRNGLVQLITAQEVAGLRALPADQQAAILNAGQFFYSPFHYVLDATSNEFEQRAYYLDAPLVLNKTFVTENDSTLLQVSVASYNVIKESTGYSLYLKTTSSEEYQGLSDDELQIQLAFYPTGERDRAYLNGTLFNTGIDKERIWKFNLSSNFDLNNVHNLYLTNFLMYTEDQKTLPTTLEVDFDVFFTTTASLGSQYIRSSIEDAMGETFLPSGSKAIMHEKLRVRFGHALDTLWCRSRTIVAAENYRRYEVDIPALYEQDVYQRDAASGSIFSIGQDGELVYTILHTKGDPVLDEEGLPVLKHKVGEIMLDSNNIPMTHSPRKIARLCDVFLIDGVYSFVTAEAVTDYRTEMTQAVVSWLTEDLIGIDAVLLEKTRIYFYPKTTIGDIDVLVEDGIKAKMSAQQSFNVTLYVSDRVYNDPALQETLSSATVSVILAEFAKAQVAISQIIENLRQAYGSDVIDVVVTGFGGAEAIDVATITNNTARFSLKKRLVALADNTITLTNDVNFTFARHRVV